MKLPSTDIQTTTNLNTKEYQFKIDEEDQGIIFEMLRSKIYKDPISSICREIASNSRDAHREANVRNKPIEIIISNQNIMNNGSTTIEFKDYGTGISEDRMENIFCKYAASTKRDSNKMTGGFGLGAKTPFSYSDVFYIRTVFDKVLYTYTAYIDESMKGKITLHKKVDTIEPNCTSIIVPIKTNDDRRLFEFNCKYYTSYWDVKPILKGFDVTKNDTYEDNIVHDGKSFKIIHKKSRHQGPIALIDGIPYTIDTNAETLFNKSLGYNSPVTVMEFKNGELDISINRENLQYTKKTINILNKRFKSIKEDLVNLFNDYIKDSAHYLEACYRIYSAERNNNDKEGMIYSWLTFYNSSKDINIMYKGEEIDNQINIKHLRFNKYTYNGNRPYIENVKTYHLKELYLNDIYLLPEGKSSTGPITEEILKNSKNKSFILIGKRKFAKREPKNGTPNQLKEYINDKVHFEKSTEEEYELITKKLGKPILDYTSVKLTNGNIERSLPVSTHVKLFSLSSKRYSYSSNLDWSNLIMSKKNIIDNKNEYAYLMIEKQDDFNKISRKTSIDYFFVASVNGKKLICITKRQEKYFESYANIEDLKKTVDKQYLNKYSDYLKLKQLLDKFDSEGYSKYTFKNDEIQNSLKNVKDNFEELKKNKDIEKLKGFNSYIESYMNLDASEYVNKFEKIIQNIPERYPLLKSLSRWNLNDSIIKEINFYLQCKDEVKTI